MAFASWFCINTTKTLFLKIVHPGGHVELHDRPILAAELMLRNPKCCVAYPHVFRQPWAIAPPHTTLLPGQKFYVVPFSTIRKLQFKHSPSKSQENPRNQRFQEQGFTKNSFWLFRNKKSSDPPYSCLEQASKSDSKDGKKQGFDVGDNCFSWIFTGVWRKIESRKDSGKKKMKKMDDVCGKKDESPRKLGYVHTWQPNLWSIDEE